MKKKHVTLALLGGAVAIIMLVILFVSARPSMSEGFLSSYYDNCKAIRYGIGYIPKRNLQIQAEMQKLPCKNDPYCIRNNNELIEYNNTTLAELNNRVSSGMCG